MNEAPRPVAAIAVATLLLAACGSTDRAAAPAGFAIDPGAVTAVSIAQGTQARVGDLRIGLGSVRTADYVEDHGETRRGPVAVLQMALEGDPPKTERVAVHAGQVVELGGYAIFIEEVREGGLLEGLGPPGTPSGGVSIRVRGPTASVGTDACVAAAASRTAASSRMGKVAAREHQ